MKIAVGGGAPVVLCEASMLLGASWAPDNTILFGQPGGIMRVSANGGMPDLIIKAGQGEELYGPQLLPRGNAILFSVTTDMGTARWDQAQVVVQLLSGGARTVVVQRGSDARYLASGHLVYALGDGLFGVGFDLDRLVATGGAVSLVQGVQRPVGVNAAGSNYGVSDTGKPGVSRRRASSRSRSLVWRSRDGSRIDPIASIPAGNLEDPRLSPDGGRVLLTLDGDIWAYDLVSGRRTPLTRDGSSLMGVWDPTGTQLAYSSARAGNLEAWVAPSDGSGQPRQLTRLGGQVHVDSWSPDGRTLGLHHHVADGPTSIHMFSMDRDDPEPKAFLDDGAGHEGASFSPDGRYVAYLSTESGVREIYVRPYPGPGAGQRYPRPEVASLSGRGTARCSTGA